MTDFTPLSDQITDAEGFRALGVTFSKADQALVLERFTMRYTGDNKPTWATVPDLDGQEWPLQFATDADWLAHTYFAVSMAGRLDRRVKRCWERPTWPGDPMAYGMLIRDLPPEVHARFGVNLRQHGWSAQFNNWLRAHKEKERLRDAEDEAATRGMSPPEKLAYLADRYKDES